MATSLSIKGKTQANDAVTSTINYVNPNATDTQLVSLATAMNNLTTNTVADITKIEKNSLLNKVEKLSRNAAISPATVASSALTENIFQNAARFNITFTGAEVNDLQVKTVDMNEDDDNMFAVSWYTSGAPNEFVLAVAKSNDPTTPVLTGSIIVSVPENDIYQSGSVTLTVTE